MKRISIEIMLIPDCLLNHAKVQKDIIYLLNGKHAISSNRLR